MTEKDIIEKAVFNKDEYCAYAKFNDYNSLFKCNITYQIFFDDYRKDDFKITPGILESINRFLGFGSVDLDWIKEEGYKHFLKCMEYTDYGIPDNLLVKFKNNHLDANINFFKIFNKEESFSHMDIQHVDILEQKNSDVIDIYLILCFAVPWEKEHGLKFTFKNTEFKEID